MRDHLPAFAKGVSVGEWCLSAHRLAQAGWRTEAYPFDYLRSDAQLITECLNDPDGMTTHFLDRAAVTRDEPHPAYRGRGSLVFVHLQNKQYLDVEHQQYTRRVARWHDLFRPPWNARPILFVHVTERDGDEANAHIDRMASALRKRNPACWLLVVNTRTQQCVPTISQLRVDNAQHRLTACIASPHCRGCAHNWQHREEQQLWQLLFAHVPVRIDTDTSSVVEHCMFC